LYCEFSASGQTSISEPLIGVSIEELEKLGIYIDMDVYIFTEVRGKESQERGTVKFIGMRCFLNSKYKVSFVSVQQQLSY